MSILSRLMICSAVAFGAVSAIAGEPAKDAPPAQAGRSPNASRLENLEFAGVSTVGKKTMINLFDKEEKRNFWIEAGVPQGTLTVVKYDNAHDQITVRQGASEKLLPLRAESAVVNAPAAAVGTLPTLPAAVPATAPGAVASPTPTPSQTTLSQARQEEEARMLVSDLLEIGMVQRKAYEEAKRKAAAGNQPVPADAPAQPAAAQATPTGQAEQPAPPAQPTQSA